MFEKRTFLKKLVAREKLYMVTMEKVKKSLSFMFRVKELPATLRSVIVKSDDRKLAIDPLDSFNSSFDTLIVSLNALGTHESRFRLTRS